MNDESPLKVVPFENPYAFALANPDRIRALADSLGMSAKPQPHPDNPRATENSKRTRFKVRPPQMPSLPVPNPETNISESSRGGAETQ